MCVCMCVIIQPSRFLVLLLLLLQNAPDPHGSTEKLAAALEPCTADSSDRSARYHSQPQTADSSKNQSVKDNPEPKTGIRRWKQPADQLSSARLSLLLSFSVSGSVLLSPPPCPLSPFLVGATGDKRTGCQATPSAYASQDSSSEIKAVLECASNSVSK